jgi:uroporphyrinogen-III synthase
MSKLNGLNVLLTRPSHQVEEPAARLRELGANVICLPLIEIAPPESWRTFDAAVSRMGDYNWIIFASANAVDAFFKRLEALGQKELNLPRIATIGRKTTERLQAYGHDVAFQAEQFVAESFVNGFPSNQGERVLWPKANIGRMLIAEELGKKGVRVDSIHVYQTTLPADSETVATELELLIIEKSIDVLTLASSQTARNLRKLLDIVHMPNSALSAVKILAIGPETAKTAVEELGKCDVQSKEYTVDGMIDSLLSLQRS